MTAAEVEKRKPAPDNIVQCIQELHVIPENCIVIGDSTSDVMAAKVAATITVAVCIGVNSFAELNFRHGCN